MPRLTNDEHLQLCVRPVWPPADIIAALFDAMDGRAKFRVEHRDGELFIVEHAVVTSSWSLPSPKSVVATPTPANDNLLVAARSQLN